MVYKLNKTKVATYVCLALSSYQAFAVENEPTEIEVIEVKGLRSSMSNEIAAKRDASSVSDSIIAEEIGKSSDENIAEAISRIAGISLDQGGQSITVRGIQASLNDIKLNGVSMTSSSDNQAVDLSVFSADILSRIDVVKSPSANQEEGSLGASINLQTRAPLTVKNNQHIVSVEGRYSEMSEESTPRFSYSFVQNFSDSVGFSGSLFHDHQIARKEDFSTNSSLIRAFVSEPDNDKTTIEANLYDFDTGEAITASADAPLYAVYNSYYLNRVNLDDKIKKGGTVTFQLKPSEDTDIRLDATFSRQENEHDHSQVRLNNFDRDKNGWVRDIYVRRGEDGLSNTVYQAKTNRIGGQVQASHYDSTIDNKLIGLNIDHLIGDFWSIKARLGHSETLQDYGNSSQVNWGPVTAAVNGPSSDWCSINYVEGPQGDFLPEMGMCANFDGTDPDTLKIQQYRTNVRSVDDTKSSAYIDIERVIDDSLFTSIEFGAKHTKREKMVQSENINLSKTYFEEQKDILASSVTDNNLTEGRFLDGIVPAGAPNSWVFPSLDETTAILFPEGFDTSWFKSDPSKSSNITEETKAAYLQVNFSLFDDTVWGNFGTRYVETQTTGNSNSSIKFIEGLEYVQNFMEKDENGGDPNEVLFRFPNETEHNYDNWLPSATINWAIDDDLIFRTAVARVMARPKIDETRPNYAIRADSDLNSPRGNGGNPYLDPFLADQLDIALEWYFDEGSLLSAGFFYKDFVSFTYKTNSQIQFVGEDFPLFGQPGAPDCLIDQSLVDENNPAPCANITYETTVNGGSADIKGLELTYQQHYDFLPGFLQHLGTSINYTYADSKAIVHPEDLDSPYNNMPFLNTSKHSANIRAYWENDWSSYRLAYSYRGRSMNKVVSNNSSLIAEAKGTLDFSANFALTKNLKVTFAATNLTNEYDKVYDVITNVEGYSADSGIVREMSNNLEDVPDDRIARVISTGRNYRLFVRYQF